MSPFNPQVQGLSLWRGVVELMPHRRSMPEICAEVCERYGVTLEDLKGPERSRRCVYPRHAAMWEMAKQAHLSLPMIGDFLGKRDHTTILHGIRTHQRRLDAAALQEAA